MTRERLPLQFKVRRASETSTSTTGDESKLDNETSNSASSTPFAVSSKSKGLNIFAVSPLTTKSTNCGNSSSNGRSCNVPASSGRQQSRKISSDLSGVSPMPSLSEVTGGSEYGDDKLPILKHEISLPSKKDLLKMSIDEQLRVLALKEMCVVEIKDQIQNLNSKLANHEAELHSLREIIQRSLYQDLRGVASNTAATLGRQRTNSNPRDQAIESLRTKRRSISNGGIDIESRSQLQSQSQSQDHTSENSKSKIWSGLTKPFNLLQQFDTLLQNEFEKSLIMTDKKSVPSNSNQTRTSEDSANSEGSILSPLRSKTPNTLRGAYKDRKSEDMLQTVSSSIWSFVNDVKTNVLSSLSEEESGVNSIIDQSDSLYTLENGSVVSLRKPIKKGKDKKAMNNYENEEELLIDMGDEYSSSDEKVDLSLYRKQY
ncbi:TDA11 [Candida oxycetoniae]|uniref:TDA11 n=1 Tax=Candida oxycetoniae TaxID=497107 RepID=A0AAI9WWA2_9ASCO|nr:TDA11 [Candida oxycetoniae]KAI3402738.2 TDA11 [Candida oxycetoniae]